jgi:hypothetical protein
MAVLTQDRNTVRKQGDYAAYPVKGGETVYAGSLVCIDANGYAVAAADTAGYRFVGVARGNADNSSGQDSDMSVEVWRRGCFEFAATGMTLADAGGSAYLLDDQTVGLAATATNDVPCGLISEYISATSVYVDIAR